MERIFELCTHFNGESDNRPMDSFDDFLKSIDMSKGKKRDANAII
jgi:hypothetical protein